MATKRKIEKRYKLTNKVLDTYLAQIRRREAQPRYPYSDPYGNAYDKYRGPDALDGLPRHLITRHGASLPQVAELITGAMRKQRPLNKKDALFVSRELARADIETREKTQGLLFSQLIPSQEIVSFGEAARAKALQIFYKDVESIMIKVSKDPYAYMIDFKRFVDVEQRHKFFGLPAFCRKEGLSWAKFMRRGKVRRGEFPPGGRQKIVQEWREYSDVMRRNMLYIMELVREKIILDNIALFGTPQVDTFSGAPQVDAFSYGGIVRIENADSIPEEDLSALKTDLLSFQALTAPTTSRAYLNITVRYKIIDKGIKRDVSDPMHMYEYTPHYSNYDKSVRLFKNAGNNSLHIKGAVYHEMMHAVDYAAPGLMRQTFAFLKTRCGIVPCEDVEFYPELMGGRGSMSFGVRDSFMSAYTGCIYVHGLPDPNSGPDSYGNNATEVSTTSIDQFAYPETMLSLLSNDPELFSHALAICYGTYFDLNPERV